MKGILYDIRFLLYGLALGLIADLLFSEYKTNIGISLVINAVFILILFPFINLLDKKFVKKKGYNRYDKKIYK